VKQRNEVGVWSVLYKAVMRHARMSRDSGGKLMRRSQRSVPHYFQRCAVRVTYTRNAVKGQWAAHGRYLARETAQAKGGNVPVGFDAQGESVDLAVRLGAWQRAGDERIWKLIISPEFGDRVDLVKLASDLMQRVEVSRHGAPLEWVATAHFNTEHPHVHIALRGVDRDGEPVRFRREFIKQGIREIAQNLCTQQLGYRTEHDAATAQRREVNQFRFTSLDRLISRSASEASSDGDAGHFRVLVSDPDARGVKDGARLRNQHILERLIALQRMGLAEPADAREWKVWRNFESVLRGMQRVADRQRTLADHGVPLSDGRLPIDTMDGRDWTILEGRVLVHGEGEAGRDAGRSFLMLEGTDARVHYIPYTPEIEDARNRGQLRTNSFIRLRRGLVGDAPLIEVEDLGDADSVLRNKHYLRQAASQLSQRGIVPEEAAWGGWLGRYQIAVRQMALELEQNKQSELTYLRNHETSRGR
jgi:hypothetical protein